MDMCICERYLDVFNMPKNSKQYKTFYAAKDSITRPVIFPSPGREVMWNSYGDFKLNDAQITYFVAYL